VLTYVVPLHSGHRYTIRAEEVRSHASGFIEFLAAPQVSGADPAPEKQVIAVIGWSAVLSVVAREFLVASEEPGAGAPRPHMVAKIDPIPF